VLALPAHVLNADNDALVKTDGVKYVEAKEQLEELIHDPSGKTADLVANEDPSGSIVE
jgi:hypothetical protein